MAIIKQGSKHSARIQKFSFQEDSAEGADLSGQPISLQYPPSSVSFKEEAAPEEPGVPSLDVAQVEKTAYENGFRQGEKAGMEIAEKKVEAIMRRYSDTLMELGRLRAELYEQVEGEVVKLALEVAKKIVHREVQADKEIIQTLVRIALSHVAEKTAVTVHLHPTDYNFILERKAELSQSDHGVREVALLADRSIERGGCLVKTECGDIDARIEEEFREVERGFSEGLK
ncbi:MAG TPA: FliH/SctL family protein [Acidobacteriota bacterium]|nr:FliH/SctL family protein [Acidobacteriota bacterium]